MYGQEAKAKTVIISGIAVTAGQFLVYLIGGRPTIETRTHSPRVATRRKCRQPRVKTKRIFGIWYLHSPEWLRKPDGSKLSQTHYFNSMLRSFFIFIFLNSTVSAHWAKMWRHPSNRCFLLVVTWFFYFFQISEVHPKPYTGTGRHIRATFGVNRSGDSFN